MTLTTERLILRDMTADDFDALFAVLGDESNMQHYPYALDEAKVRYWIDYNLRRYRIFGFGLLAVCLKNSGEMIGDCGLTMQPIDGMIRPEIGYHIRRDQQRKGYATEAAIAVRDWAFQHTPFQTLYSYMTADNIASQKTAMSYGCHFVNAYTDKASGELHVYAITRP